MMERCSLLGSPQLLEYYYGIHDAKDGVNFIE